MAGFLKKVQSQKLGAKLKDSLNATKESLNAAKNKADVLIAAAAVDIHANVESTMERFEINYDKHLAKPVKLTAKVWKRRGGMAKYNHRRQGGGNAWELRRMELRGTALLYYNALEQEEIVFGGNGSSRDLQSSETSTGSAATTPTKTKLSSSAVWNSKESPMNASTTSLDESGRDVKLPRGLLDLKEEKATVHASMGHQSGAPSPFCLSIMTGLVKQETKWKLAFDDQASLMLWLAALTDIVVQTSIDEYNVQLLNAANPNNPDPPVFLRPPPVYEPSKKPADNNLDGSQNEASQQPAAAAASPATVPTHHQLWFTGDYSITNNENLQPVSTDATDTDGITQHVEPPTPTTPNSASNNNNSPPSSIEKLPSMLDQTRALQDLERQHLQERKQWEELHRRELQAAQAKIDELTHTNNTKAEANVAAQAQLRDRDVLQAKKAIELEKAKKELVELQETMDYRLEKLQEQIELLQAKHQRAMQEMEERHSKGNNHNSQQSGKDPDGDDKEAMIQKKLNEKEEQIAKLLKELQELQAAHQRRVKQLEDNLSTTEQSKVMAIKLVEDQWQKKLDKEKQQAQKRLEAASKGGGDNTGADDDKEKQIAELTSELDSMRASTTEQIKSLQDELSEAETKHKGAVQAAQEESQKVIAELQQELQLQTEKIAHLEKGSTLAAAPSIDDSHSEFLECDEFEDAVG